LISTVNIIIYVIISIIIIGGVTIGLFLINRKKHNKNVESTSFSISQDCDISNSNISNRPSIVIYNNNNNNIDLPPSYDEINKTIEDKQNRIFYSTLN